LGRRCAARRSIFGMIPSTEALLAISDVKMQPIELG
jgi:hypothetical protein